MQRDQASNDVVEDIRIAAPGSRGNLSCRGAYGTQVLIAGRRKHWRDEVGAQVRRAGCRTTSVDSGKDALAVLVLGLPVDVLVTDADLHGDLGCSRLAREACALRPNLRIILARDAADRDLEDVVPNAVEIPPGSECRIFAKSVREAIAARS